VKPLLENAALTTDMDCRFNNLLNVNSLIPVPPGLVVEGDPRLSDARNPIDGSVTDVSVATDAGIVQSKLNLNGLIPTNWLGTTSTTAARGSLAEYFANKAQPNGYASLDGTGKVPISQVPSGAGSGTVTSIGLAMPAHFAITGSPVTTSGVISVAWVNIAAVSWLGNANATAQPPAFNINPLPVALIPSLATNKIVSGVFDPARLPIAVGVGVSHAPGAAPDPGSTGSVFDYLARDMTYKQLPVFGPGYQPKVQDPIISINVLGAPPYTATIVSPLPGASLFYSINSPSGGFQPVPDNGQVLVFTGQTIYAYGAKVGYTNSNIVYKAAPIAPPGEHVTVVGDGGIEDVLGDDGLFVTVGP
jgi:hypothetical protein